MEGSLGNSVPGMSTAEGGSAPSTPPSVKVSTVEYASDPESAGARRRDRLLGMSANTMSHSRVSLRLRVGKRRPLSGGHGISSPPGKKPRGLVATTSLPPSSLFLLYTPGAWFTAVATRLSFTPSACRAQVAMSFRVHTYVYFEVCIYVRGYDRLPDESLSNPSYERDFKLSPSLFIKLQVQQNVRVQQYREPTSIVPGMFWYVRTG